MVFDETRGVMVLFGGIDFRGSAPVDTWEFSSNQWRRVALAGPPGGREFAALAYDPDHEVVIMTGGGEWGSHGFGSSKYCTDTWQWDGYNTVTIDALFDAQGALLEAGGALTFREQLDSYTYADFVNGTFDTNLVVEGEILWEGRWTLYPPQNTAVLAISPTTGATTLLLHEAAHGEPEQIPFDAWIIDPGS